MSPITPELQAKINFLYYETACNVARIAKRLGISPASARQR